MLSEVHVLDMQLEGAEVRESVNLVFVSKSISLCPCDQSSWVTSSVGLRAQPRTTACYKLA